MRLLNNRTYAKIAEKPNLSNRQDAFSTRGFRQRAASRREERLSCGTLRERAASRREEFIECA
ncbi:hypothetical protein NSTC745_00047 [Nostoc sp. DSM 114161]|jgi:hypothetical protein|uniref:hypothetical protein n=1 Tax=Nostoc sp. DSM 114161 TaxID=3440143 RepID=UPI0040457CA4